MTQKNNNLLVKQTQLLIDGTFQDSVSHETFETLDPATEECITEVAKANAQDVDCAVRSSLKALDEGPWSTMDARERGRRLYEWAALIDKHQDPMARLEVLDNGKPISDAVGDVGFAAETIRYFAGWTDKIEGKTIPTSGPFFTHTRREPVGVCGLIIPWNYPLAMAAWKVGPALAAGCTAILKPAEQTPLTALYLGQLALEAGIPPGVLNILPGFGAEGAGEALVRHPLVNKIAFTGESKTAEHIKLASIDKMKRLSFELGGKSPNIVFDDANLDDAIPGAAGAIFANQGQNCCAGSRLFVHEKIYDEFVEKLAVIAKARRVGQPFDPNTEHGAQIDKAQFDKIMHYIAKGKEEGAECVAGGERFGDKGYFISPTVFANTRDEMSITTDEIFGPVASVLKFTDMDEVISRANATDYGLAGAVWTQNINRVNHVIDKLKAGTVWVNCYNVVDIAAPFGGYKQSGLGRELGEQGLDAYLETKTVTIKQ
jgi:aldehyde dehydrogenase (NAD+)